MNTTNIMDIFGVYLLAGVAAWMLVMILMFAWAWFRFGRELRTVSKVVTNDEYIDLKIGLVDGFTKDVTVRGFLINSVLWPLGLMREISSTMDQIEDARDTVRECMKKEVGR